MKALTLTCPWAHAVAHWGKPIENRTWPPPDSLIGERLAIHAGKSPFRELPGGGLHLAPSARDELQAALNFIRDAAAAGVVPDPVVGRELHKSSSAIVCVVTVAGWVKQTDGGGYDSAPGTFPRLDAFTSPWFVGPYGWVLADRVTLARPVPCKGAQGLWTLPADVEAAVNNDAHMRAQRAKR